MKGFKYQITMTALLYKHKMDGNIEYSPVYFNSATKTVINFEYCLDKSFQEILYRIDNWVNKGSGWVIGSIDGEYVNISAYSPSIGSRYIEFLSGFKNSKKGLINIRNNDNKCFLWCHIRHLNLVEKNPQRITKEDKEMINKLNYEEIKNDICINVFCYESGLTYPIYVSNQKFKDCMDFLLISNENKSHYVYQLF